MSVRAIIFALSLLNSVAEVSSSAPPTRLCPPLKEHMGDLLERFVVSDSFLSPASEGSTIELACAESEGYFTIFKESSTPAAKCRAEGWDVQLHCARSCDVSSVSWHEAAASGILSVSPSDYLSAGSPSAWLRDGQSIQVTCGADVSITQQLLCVDGILEPLTLTCLNPCLPLSLPASHEVVPNTPQQLSHGSTWQVQCASGYQTSLTQGIIKEVVTCLNGTFTPVTIVCERACPPFTMKSDNLIKYLISPLEVSKQNSPSGTSATVTCAEGFLPRALADGTLSSPTSTIYCDPSGWIEPTLTCDKGCDMIDSATVLQTSGRRLLTTNATSLMVSTGIFGESKFPAGTRLTVGCEEGFAPPESYTSQSEEITCTGSQWSVSQLSCRKMCTALPNFLTAVNSVFALTSPVESVSSFRHGHGVSFTCQTGFSSASKASDTSTCVDGIWTSPALVCEKNCLPFNLTLTVGSNSGLKVNGVEEHDLFSLIHSGDTVELGCADGAKPVKQSKQKLSCRHGSWESVTLQCSQECGEFSHRTGSAYIIQTDDSNSMGARRVLSCNEEGGYFPVRGENMEASVCTASGHWTVPSLMCGRDCAPLHLETVLPSPLDRYEVLTSSAPLTNMTTQSMPHSSFLTVKCDALKSSPETGSEDAVATIMCLEGEWTKAGLSCMNHCPALVNDTSIEVWRFAAPIQRSGSSVASLTPPEAFLSEQIMRHGSSFKLSCRSDSIAQPEVPGYSVINCADGKWSLPDVFCKMPCREYPNNFEVSADIRVPSSIKMISSPVPNAAGLVGHGAQVELTCQDFYTNTWLDDKGLPIDQSASVCSDGRWTTAELDCKAMCMPFSLEAERYQWSFMNRTEKFSANDTMAHGAEYLVTCAPGTSSKNLDVLNETISCSNGYWKKLSLQCMKDCDDFPALPEGTAALPIAGPKSHGATRTVECITDPKNKTFEAFVSSWEYGYTEITGLKKQIARCDDGQWSPLNVLCKRQCGALRITTGYAASPSDNNNSTSRSLPLMNYYHGAKREITCATNFSDPYSLAKQDSVQCVDGAWTAHNMNCRRQCPGNKFYRVPWDQYTASPMIDTSSKTFIDHSTIVKFGCASGYSPFPTPTQDPSGSMSRVMCLDGNWTSLSVRCFARCLPYDRFNPLRERVKALNDEESLNYYDPVTNTHAHLSTITVQCSKGSRDPYNYTRTEETLQCFHGAWSSQTLHCRSDCGPYQTAENYRYSISAPDAVEYEKLIANGTATKVAISSTAKMLTPIENISYALYHGQRRVVTCNKDTNPGYYPVKLASGKLAPSTSTVMCNDGMWSPHSLQCFRNCDGPELLVTDPIAYTMDSKASYHGATVRFACASSYVNTVGAQPAATTCVDGQWTPLSLRCEKSCMPFEQWAAKFDPEVLTSCTGKLNEGSADIDNGKCASRYVLSGDMRGDLPGSSVEISCQFGTGPTDPNAASTQKLRCVDGQWEARVLSCQHYCNPLQNLIVKESIGVKDYSVFPNPYSVTPASATFLDVQKTMVRSGSTYRVQCNLMWEPEQTTNKVQNMRCMDGQWEPQTLFCVPMCIVSEEPGYDYYGVYFDENNQVVTPTTIGSNVLVPNGSVRRVRCPKGHSSVPDNARYEVTCTNGQFNAPDFFCYQDCPLPDDLNAINLDEDKPIAYFVVNGDLEQSYISASTMITRHPEVSMHGGEFQLMCRSHSETGKPYRVRAAVGSKMFANTLGRRNKKDSKKEFSSGWEKWLVFSLMAIFYSAAILAVSLVTAPAIAVVFGALLATAGFGKAAPLKGAVSFFKGAMVDPFKNILKAFDKTSKQDQKFQGMLMFNNDLAMTHTSALYEYYGFFCANCGFGEDTIQIIAKSGGSFGPYKRVQCVHGSWTNQDFSCVHYRDTTELTKGRSSRSVMCSQQWRDGTLSDMNLQADAIAGKMIPQWVMQGYHTWASVAIPALDRVPSMKSVVDPLVMSVADVLVSPQQQFVIANPSQVNAINLIQSFVGLIVLASALPVTAVSYVVYKLSLLPSFVSSSWFTEAKGQWLVKSQVNFNSNTYTSHLVTFGLFLAVLMTIPVLFSVLNLSKKRTA